MSFTYQGDISSANAIWSSPSWHYRKSLKDKYNKLFLECLAEKEFTKFKSFELIAFYHSRHDCDNLCMLHKILVDSIKGVWVENDGPKFYKGTATFFDPSLPKNTVEYHFIGQ